MAAHEIADSDDDEQLSDGALDFETAGTTEDAIRAKIDPQASGPLEDINFSQFLSQSQSYNGLASSQPPTQKDTLQPNHVHTQDLSPTQPFSTAVGLEENNGDQKSTGSTERMRRDIEQIQGRFFDNGPSPTFSSNTPSSRAEHSSGKLKRARDAAVSFSSQPSEDEGGIRKKKRTYGGIGRSKFSRSLPNSFHQVEEDTNLETAEDTGKFIDPSKLQADACDKPDLEEVPMAAATINYTGVRTMNSSVGGHQTLTLTDPNHNPFADEATNTSGRNHQTARIAEIFRPFQRASGTASFTSLNLPSSGDPATDGNVIQEPEDRNDHSNDDNPPPGGTWKRRQSDVSVLAEQSNKVDEPMDMEVAEAPTQPKRRGRKPKAKPAQSENEQVLSDNYGGKKLTVKQLDSSPKKNPSSELHLSDEAFIGLPKENYIPRPTRRGRGGSNRPEMEASADKAEDLEVLSQASRISQTSKRSQETGTPLEDEPVLRPTTKLGKRKPPKKGKGRKGKTSALTEEDRAATDDDDDSTHLNGKSTTKVEEPSNNLYSNDENLGTDADHGGVEDTNEQSDNNIENEDDRDLTDVTVEVRISRNGQELTGEEDDEDPRVLEAREKEMPVSRKRGRKPKKSTPAEPVAERNDLAEDEVDEVKATTVQQADEASPVLPKRRGRPPLKGKSINVPTTAAPTEDGEPPIKKAALAPTSVEMEQPAMTPSVSPIIPQTNVIPDSNQDNDGTAVSTPPKRAPGPTKHSPITQSGGSVKYRVGLSKRAQIPSLLSKVKRDTAAKPGK